MVEDSFAQRTAVHLDGPDMLEQAETVSFAKAYLVEAETADIEAAEAETVGTVAEKVAIVGAVTVEADNMGLAVVQSPP
jgi:hypothetical protein